ncbi:MAG TPA: outer membrane lipoprotein-sorting protein [Candidatus Acidoferrales bacterium]|jgi:outer membrane lipoprotein-sorting protein|nr:outer membrane lipoprotein-sorting protein [Candidatus Acidoferrales bacterium]
MRIRTILFSLFISGIFSMTLAVLRAPAAAARQGGAPVAAAVGAQKAPLTVEQVVSQLVERNREREEALRKFQGTRVYSLKYTGFFGAHSAEMTVNVNYASPDNKQFTIVSQSGSKFIVDHVLKGLLDGEKEAANPENKKRTALNADNYDFSLAGMDASEGTPQYILEVKPKKDSKFVYRGRIWVDGKDFAVTRIQAEPAKSPSFWVKRSEVNHRYEKVAEFWLPEENRTESLIRLGGKAVLSIEYRDYKITEAAPIQSVGASAKASIPTS